jgi:hypothetical protein
MPALVRKFKRLAHLGYLSTHLIIFSFFKDKYLSVMGMSKDADNATLESICGISSATTPIYRLPPELLIEIFTLCTCNQGLAVLWLGTVCRDWRDLIYGSPRVWQLISLDDARASITTSHTQANMWMANSSPLPFDVKVNLSSVNLLLPLLSPILPYMNRWRRFTVMGARENSLHIQELRESGYPLDTLILHIQHSVHQDASYDPTFLINFFSLAMNIRVTSLPRPPSITQLRFTSITIHEIEVDISHERLLNFLCACPDLRYLNFEQAPFRETPIKEQLPVASLPHLTSLYLRSAYSARAILSHIDTPKLQSLFLRQLNVEFRMGGFDGDDDGDDSDGEPEDFSQSPDSDRATGLGLRVLITRCNPPLAILDMDYSDMRRRDFRWCFNRLTTLQEFRIVASDMSDTVIRYFLPLPSTLPRLGETGWRLKVRLPQLKKLVLQNCQQLSGDAIADSIQSRVLLIQAGLVEAVPFSEVAVIECNDFLHRHAQQLSMVLGSRFRTSA